MYLPLSLRPPENPVHLDTAWVLDRWVPGGFGLIFGQGRDPDVPGWTGQCGLVGLEALGDLAGVGQGAELGGGLHQGNAPAPVQAARGNTRFLAAVTVVRAVCVRGEVKRKQDQEEENFCAAKV